MIKLLQKIYITALLALGVSMASAAGPWFTDIEAGVKRAKADDKLVMVEFTGSDWCPPCIMMNKQVFTKEEFLKQAQEDYVLVKVDLPNSDMALKEANGKVAQQWEVGGFPTILLLNMEGEEVTRFVASAYPTVEKFIALLKKEARRKDML